MNGAARWTAFRMTFLNENLVNGVLNGCINLLLRLCRNIWWPMSTNRAVNGRPSNKPENNQCEVSCHHEIAALTATKKCPHCDAQANEINCRIQPLNGLGEVVKDRIAHDRGIGLICG